MPVSIEREGPTVLLALDWQDRRNALGVDEGAELVAALQEQAELEPATLVLTGRGRAFCAGGDLRHFAELSGKVSDQQLRDHVYGTMQEIIRLLASWPMPTVAAVDGPAVGLGMDLALATDHTFVGPQGWLMQGWGRMGLIAGTGGVELLRRRNRHLLWQLLAEQPRLDAAACERHGLAIAVTDGTALEAAVRWAGQINELPADVLAGYVSLHRAPSSALLDHLTQAAELQGRFINSAAFRERALEALA